MAEKAMWNLAQYLYQNERKDVKEIAKLTGIAESTLYKKIKTDNWDANVFSQDLSKIRIANDLLWQIQEISRIAKEEKRLLTPGESDSLMKLHAMVEKLNPEVVFVANAIEALTKFDAFLGARFPDLKRTISEPMVLFIQDIATRHVKP